MVDPPEREKLRRLLDNLQVTAEAAAGDGPHSGPYGGACVVRCSCDPQPNGDGGQTVVDPIRLLPLREDVALVVSRARADLAGIAADQSRKGRAGEGSNRDVSALGQNSKQPAADLARPADHHGP